MPPFDNFQNTNVSSTFGSNTTSSVFGQPTQASGQSSVGFGMSQPSGMFGQSIQPQGLQSVAQPLFGQTSPVTSTNSNTQGQISSGFGSSNLFQNTGPGFGQMPSFGQVSSPSLFSNSGFGQVGAGSHSVAGSSVFDKSTATTAARPGFGQLANKDSANPFGFGQSNTTTPGFSQANSPLFGKSLGSNVGQSSGPTSSGGSSSSTPSQLPFSNVTATSPPSLFGKPTSTSSSTGVDGSTQSPFPSFPASTIPSLFGQTASISTSQSTLFRKPVSTSAFSAAPSHTSSSVFGQSPTLFGKPPEQSNTQSTASSSSGFGQNTDKQSRSQSTGFSTSGAETKLFGKTQGTGSGKVGVLFGKDPVRQSGSSVSAGSENESKGALKPSGLFGKGFIKSEAGAPETKSGKASVGSGIKTEDTSHQVKSEKTAGLFGKKQETSEDDTANKYLFGKSTFGKSDNAQSAGLFGKVKDEQGSSEPGRPQISRSTDSQGLEEAVGKQQKTARQSLGLFGKPKVSSDSPSSSRSPVSRGLFDKQEPQGRQDRILFGKRVGVSGRRPSRSGSDDKDQAPPLRRQVSDDISSKVAIVCRNLLPRFYNTNVLRSHFRKFGEVTKVFPNPTKGQATVHFKTHEAAADAKRRGRFLGKNTQPMTIFWSAYSGPGTPKHSPRETDRQPSRPVKRNSDASSLPSSKRTSWQGNQDIDDELQGMAGTQDLFKGREPSPQPGTSGITQQQPEKRTRTASPAPIDVKGEDVGPSMFEGVTARSTTERVHLLNLRDKYIRQHRKKKNRDISTAKAFLGTCMDMCPEKERYDREDKRRLSVYEIFLDTENEPGRNPPVDHSRAVKEYIRSSPDQDEPLPHELRPLPVLVKTMVFLLCDVANQGEDGHWADWFDYLWNRTRGIRKDITQQQLCDRNTVSLIEKCARFHVFCSERLCEEDMHSFDAKINNENLTKCLQTLKELYYDLEKKQNCFCTYESEFRAYMVLMNLNEGDILRQVQQLRPEVRSSPPIKFAMQVYFSLSNNNYIKFFRLVKQASFGQACIMHRYFTQVRNRALLTMMKGYGMGTRPAQIPLGNLVRLLGFEDESEAQDFCEHYGFNVTDGEAMLDRGEYIEPETAWPARRSVTLIESKLMVSIGEMINGEPFTDMSMLYPSSSFDKDDKFHSVVPIPKRGKGHTSVDSFPREAPSAPAVKQASPLPSVPEVKVEPAATSTAPDPEQTVPKMHISNEYIKDTAKILFWEVINEMVLDLSEETMTDVNVNLNFTSEYMECLFLCTVSDEVQMLCEEVYNKEQENHQRVLQQEREARRDRVAADLMNDIVEDLIQQETLNLATIEIREVKAILRQQCIERVTVNISEDIVKEVFTDMVKEVSDDVFETDVTQRLEELDKFEKIVQLSRTGRFWNRWKKEYKAVTKLKRAMQEFPSSANMEDAAGQVKRLIHVDDKRIMDKQFYINKRAKLTIESPTELTVRARNIDTQLTVHALYQRLLYHTAWQPLDLSRVVGNVLTRKMLGSQQPGSMTGSVLYWKLVLCLPDESENSSSRETGITKHLCDWLTAKLAKGKTPPPGENIKSKVISLYKSKLSTAVSVPARDQPSLGVCIRTVSGTLDQDDVSAADEERLLLGTNGLMFVLPAGAPIQNRSAPFWKEHSLRLQQILMVKPMYQELPLVVVIPVATNQKSLYKQVIDCLSIEDLIREGLVCDVDVVMLSTDNQHIHGINLVNPECSERICESLQWLAEQTKLPPTLMVSYLKDFLESVLLELFYTPSQQNLKKRRLLGYLDQFPNSLLQLYNSVIDHMADTLTTEDLAAISWPVPEFVRTSQGVPPAHWNSEDHFEYLYETVRGMRLPEFSPLDTEWKEWVDVKRDLWQYVSMVTGRSYGPPRVTLNSRLKRLLMKVEEDFEETCYLQEGEDNCVPTCANVPWSKFISLCIDYRFATTDFSDPILATFESGTSELRVAYDNSHLDKYTPHVDWKHGESDKSILKTPALNTTVQIATVEAREKNKQDSVKLEVSIVEDPHNVSNVSVEAKKISSGLIRSLQSERRSSDHFQKYLENAMRLGEIDETSFSANSSVMDSILCSDVGAECSGMDFPRRFSFDATGYFNQARSDISRIFDDTLETTILAKRRRSDVDMTMNPDPQELSQLIGKKRRERLSEIYGNDPVMLRLKEPTLTEDFDSLKENLRTSRRESDMFDRRLQSLLTNSPMDTL